MGLFGKRKKTESKEKSVRSQRSSGNVPTHTEKPDVGKFSRQEKKRALANGGGYICSPSVELMMRAAYPDLKVSEGEALTHLTTETIDVAWEHIKGFMMDKLIPLFISRVAEFDPVAGKRLLELYKAEFSDEDVRRHAAWVLGEYGDEKAVEPLIAALGDKNSDVRKAAVEALRKIAPDDPQVKVALAKRDREEREASEQPISSSQPPTNVSTYTGTVKPDLGKLKEDKNVTELIEALTDNDPSVRKKAAEALGKIGGKKAVETLIAALRDEDEYVRRRAAEALRKIGHYDPKAKVAWAKRDKEENIRREREAKARTEEERKPGACPYYAGGNCTGGERIVPCSWKTESYKSCAAYKLFGAGETTTCPHCGAQLRKMDYSQLYGPGTQVVSMGIDNSCPSCGKPVA